MSNTTNNGTTNNGGIDKQQKEWDAWKAICLAKNQCPYSGLDGPECKSWLCDCFEFEEYWGVSQK